MTNLRYRQLPSKRSEVAYPYDPGQPLRFSQYCYQKKNSQSHNAHALHPK